MKGRNSDWLWRVWDTSEQADRSWKPTRHRVI